MQNTSKNPNLDAIRGFSVILVLFAHFHIPSIRPAGEQSSVILAINKVAGMSVDFFFVLSAALISSLLFTEYKETGSIGASRFLLRRALKIFPSFLVLIAVTALLRWYTNQWYWSSLLSELTMFQSYVRGVWLHTWSLSVEEHFYFGLCGVILLARQFSIPFRISWRLVAFALVAWGAIRYGVGTLINFKNETTRFPSILRIDSLLVGLLVGQQQVYSTYPLLNRISARTCFLLAIAIFLVPAVAGIQYHVELWNSFGISLMSASAGFLVMSAFIAPVPPKWLSIVTAGFRHVGPYTYNIYLWHMFVEQYGIRPFYSRGYFNPWVSVALYFGGSYWVGVVMTRFFEEPILRWRNRRFPAYRPIPAPPMDINPKKAA